MSLIKGTSQYSVNINVGAGDYNFDGIVNAADYTVWRDTLGSTTDLRADGDHDLVVDGGDYDTWLSKFGTIYVASGSGTGKRQLYQNRALQPAPAWRVTTLASPRHGV